MCAHYTGSATFCFSLSTLLKGFPIKAELPEPHGYFKTGNIPLFLIFVTHLVLARIMDIAFCINEAYAIHISTLMASILANTPTRPLTFHIVSSDLTPETEERLRQQAQVQHAQVVLHKVGNAVHKIITALPSSSAHISNDVYNRYLLADLLPQLDRVLYMDGDIVVQGDLTPLWKTPLEGLCCAGVEDRYINRIGHKEALGLRPEEPYLNGGVLLINLRYWREHQLGEALIRLTQTKGNALPYKDQDALSLLARGHLCRVDERFNFALDNVLFAPSQLVYSAVVLHYTGAEKPWTSIFSGIHPLGWRYQHYLRETPYRHVYDNNRKTHRGAYLFQRTKTYSARYFSFFGGLWHFAIDRRGAPHYQKAPVDADGPHAMYDPKLW